MTLKASMDAARDLLLAVRTTSGRWEGSERFQRLGSGAFRTAYLDRENEVVYKVDHTRGDANGNTGELRNLLDNEWALPYVSEAGTVWRLPEFEGFRFGDEYVVAMEYCPGYADYPYYENNSAAQWFGLTDVMGENVREGMDGACVITDAGLSSEEVRQRREKQRNQHAECDGCYHPVEKEPVPLPERDVWRA